MSRSNQYRMIPLFLASLVIFAAFSAIAILLWSVILFLGKTPFEEIGGFPTVMWIIVLALSTALITRITRGGTVFPPLFLAVVSSVVTCFFASDGTVTAGGIVLKILISLLAAIIAFIITKLLIMFLLPKTPAAPRQRRRHKRKNNSRNEYQYSGDTPLIIRSDDDFGSFVEHKDQNR